MCSSRTRRGRGSARRRGRARPPEPGSAAGSDWSVCPTRRRRTADDCGVAVHRGGEAIRRSEDGVRVQRQEVIQLVRAHPLQRRLPGPADVEVTRGLEVDGVRRESARGQPELPQLPDLLRRENPAAGKRAPIRPLRWCGSGSARCRWGGADPFGSREGVGERAERRVVVRAKG